MSPLVVVWVEEGAAMARNSALALADEAGEIVLSGRCIRS